MGAGAPKVELLPGYTHIVSPQAEPASLHCFVYEVPFDTGQAVSRLLRAAQVGIEFESLTVSRVEAMDAAPVLFLRAGYRSTDSSSIKRGLLQMAITPRWDYPVVCTFEHESSTFEKRVLSFLQNFKAEQVRPMDPPFVSEVWKLSRSGVPFGFSLLRLHENEDGTGKCLEVSASVAFEKGRVKSTDTVALQESDERGVFSGKWLEIEGTSAEFSLLLERQEQGDAAEFRFRYIGERRGEHVKGEFETNSPLATALTVYRRLERDPLTEAFSVLTYRPSSSLKAPLQVDYRPGGGELRLMVETAGAGDEVSFRREVSLGKDGLPESERGLREGVTATLLSRTRRGI